MTKLLEQAIAKLKTRSISEQDSLVENLPSAVAALILEELEDDIHVAEKCCAVELRSDTNRSLLTNRLQ